MAARVTGIESFSTACVDSAKRLEYWNDLSCNTFTGVSVDSSGSKQFSAALRRLAMENVSVADVRSTASTVRHTAVHVRNSREAPHYLLHMQLSGSSSNIQSGREAILQPGDATICDTARPWTMDFHEQARFLVCRLPATALCSRLRDVDDRVGLRFGAGSPGLGLLSPFLQNLLLQVQRARSNAWATALDSIIVDLVALSCGASIHDREGAYLPSRFQLALQYLDEHLTDPTLTIDSLSRHLGVGSRSIQKMFAAQGTTFGSYLLQQRLQRAAGQLSESAKPGVTEIALGNGFNDLTYFGRSFKQAFGMTPREFRQRRPPSCLGH